MHKRPDNISCRVDAADVPLKKNLNTIMFTAAWTIMCICNVRFLTNVLFFLHASFSRKPGKRKTPAFLPTVTVLK